MTTQHVPSIIHEGESTTTSRPVLPISADSSTSASIDQIQADTKSLAHQIGNVDSSFSLKNKPLLLHKWNLTQSILCIVPAPKLNLVFCGTQNGCILVYDLSIYSLKYTIQCADVDKSNSVLCMDINPAETHLFSAGSDSLVKVWDISCWKPNEDLDSGSNSVKLEFKEPICTRIIYTVVDIGDIFSIKWCPQFSTLFIGAQNAAIVWCRIRIASKDNIHMWSELRMPHLRYDKFFDSKGPGGSINDLQTRHEQWRKSPTFDKALSELLLVEMRQEDCIGFAHNGFVFCMELSESMLSNCLLLYSGGGDGFVNVWKLSVENNSELKLVKIHSLDNRELVLSMLMSNYLFVGLSHSMINMWDLNTLQLVRLFQSAGSVFDGSALSMAIDNEIIYKASNFEGISMFSLKEAKSSRSVALYKLDGDSETLLGAYDTCCKSSLSVKVFDNDRGKTFLVCGGNLNLCIWDITSNQPSFAATLGSLSLSKRDLTLFSDYSDENMLRSLATFISYKTISKLPALYLEDLRQCAQFTSQLLLGLGARDSKLLPVANGNPIVYSRFNRNVKSKRLTSQARTLLWYAHYDVVNATGAEAVGWDTDPFVMTAKNGNLYARGISDNKGPTLAAIFAVAELYQKGELLCNVVFIIEGEEECGSVGFQDAIVQHKNMIGPVNWIMLSNSYWLDDKTPCLNYGLRGVVIALISVTSEKPDRHSGVDGGVSPEPTMDLIQILSQLIDRKSGRIMLPDFYNNVLPLSAKELELFQKVSSSSDVHDLDTLIAKWANPSLTIHKIQVSGPKNNTVIPQTAKATVSIRIVANQQVDDVKDALVKFLREKFDEICSGNQLSIEVFHETEPWLGDPENTIYKLLRKQMKILWGNVEPLFIREGGLIPSIRFLEKCFGALAAQIPCGQSSDNAHLPGEKLRLLNLYKLREVLRETILKLE